MKENLMRKQDSIKLLSLLVLTLIAYIPTFNWMVSRWTVKDTYYSHGFLVPLLSGFIIWLKRKELMSLGIKPSNVGWLFFGVGIFIHFISSLWRVGFVSGFSLMLTLAGIVLLSLGKRYLKELAFPVSFLAFMIPLPLIVIANLSFRLKIFAARVSTFIVNKLGVPAIREGSVIRTMHSSLMVEDPCSGIRSLVALIALGGLMAYFSNLSRRKKAALFLSSIPIAVSSNVVRIVSLSLASEIYGEKMALGWFHDTMGILVFVFAFIGLAIINKVLE